MTRALGLLSLIAFTACSGTLGETDGDGSGHDASPHDASAGMDGGRFDAAASDVGVDALAADVGLDAFTPDPCDGVLLCERFDDYDAMPLSDGQTFGPWRAAVRTPGGAMDLDDAHTVSGDRALHMRIETGATAGGRLFTTSGLPIFADHPTHVYGRMMMFIEPNGTSVHWTFFGASGDAEPSSPVVGRRATYLISSLPRADVNTYSFVDGLNSTSTDPYHDCWSQSAEPMPTSRWTCVSFELDSVARRLRLSVDGGAPVLSVDDHGAGCVGDVVPDDAPWYGPAIDELYVGAWSFHDMNAPLEVWIDDLIVDTDPVACP